MPTDFYYADANSQPVGPLSLEEIRRFAAAGVVPPDVMVCEAGGENWQPLISFATPPTTAPPPRSTSPAATGSAPPNPEETARSLGFHLNHAILAMALSFGVGLAAAVGASRETDPNSVFSGLLALWAAAAEVILIYKICSTLPAHLRFTTPGKAAGFTLIPGFHLYWAFRLLPGLVEGTIRFDRESPDATRKPVPSWLVPLAYVNAVLVAVTTVVFLAEIVVGAPTGLGGQFFYAIFYAGLIVFYSTVVGTLSRILLPSEETEKPATSWGSMIWSGSIALVVVIKVIKDIIERN